MYVCLSRAGSTEGIVDKIHAVLCDAVHNLHDFRSAALDPDRHIVANRDRQFLDVSEADLVPRLGREGRSNGPVAKDLDLLAGDPS